METISDGLKEMIVRMRRFYPVHGNPRIDLAIAIAIFFVFLGVAITFELGETWSLWAEAHEAWELDEIPFAFALGSLAVGWYACRRWIEAFRMARELSGARDDLAKTHEHLLTSINSMPNGFAIWDANDRLVLVNDGYVRLRGDATGERITPGISFEDLLGIEYDSGAWDCLGKDRQDWIREGLARRRSAGEMELSVKLHDGRRLIIAERVLDNADVIASVIDVTAHHERETELQNAKRQLEQVAYHDALTGLANRAHCQKDLVEKFACADADTRLAIIQIDLDNFKRVNDTLGHAAGDHLLHALGERLSLLERAFDNFKPYRWGGDEFLAVIDRDDDTDLDMICQELNDLVGTPLSYKKATLRPTVSLGVAQFPEDATDLESLMIYADLALYKTKDLGRDGYQFFTMAMKDKIEAETRVEEELRIAVADGQFELYFQPQVSIDDETVTGLEALLRWNHPERGVLTPGAFLSIVEESGLAPAVGCKVFEYAMSAARQWADSGIEFGRLAVNLSPQHLKKGTLLDDFFGAMERHGVAPQLLSVEFLESFLLDDPNADISAILEQLRQRGIHVELDDFGTGYASLSHLSTMPINGMKIDRCFVQHMVSDPRQEGIVTSLASMSKLMDLRVVCEGVETRQQVNAITRIGNCSVQGYFVAKPMSFDDITDWIRNGRNIGIFSDLPELAVGRE